MSQSYTIQPGDTLLQIAIDHNVDFAELLALNSKYQINPDYILPGEQLILPDSPPLEPVTLTDDIPEPEALRTPDNEGCITSAPECTPKQVFDVIFLTGDKPQDYFCLDEKSAKILEQEATYTQQLIDEYKAILEKAPKSDEADSHSLEQHAIEKQAWLDKAVGSGVIAIDPSEQEEQVAGSSTSSKDESPNQARVAAKIAELEDRKRFVSNYSEHWATWIFSDELSVDVFKDKTLAEIEQQLIYWKALDERETSKPPESSNKQSVNLDNFNQQKRQLTTKTATQHVIEVYSVAQNRYIYIRHRLMQQEVKHWKTSRHQTNAMKAIKAGDMKGFGQAIADDLKQLSPKHMSPKLEAALITWKADGGKWKEWSARGLVWTNEDGETQFAVGAEAQLLRWGAKASIKSTFEPTKGKIDLGIGAEASFALAEGAVKSEAFLPFERGYSLKLDYTDANGKPATYSFGRFRMKVSLTMSCFAGVMGQAGASVNYSKEEQPAGHTTLLSPRVAITTKDGGPVQLKAEGFAGIQAGGLLCGGFEWLDPKKEHTLDFATLAEAKGEGNVAAGIGFGGDFQIGLQAGTFYFYCHGRLVWGVGGSGGIGAAINFDELWELVKVISEGVQKIDYRKLKNIDEDVYDYIVKSTYLTYATDLISDPKDAFENMVKSGYEAVDLLWSRFEENRNKSLEAHVLSKRILNNSVSGEIKYNQLTPESIGMMLDVLLTQFTFDYDEDKEKAILFLLNHTTYSWRKFEEILSRVNENGKKSFTVNSLLNNLERINAMLDGEQQKQFNRWVFELASKEKVEQLQMTPFHPAYGSVALRKRQKVSQQIAFVYSGIDTRYV